MNEPFARWWLPRATALLIVLCCFKVALLIKVHSDVVETHWRSEWHSPSVFAWINFSVFAALVFLSFALMGKCCASAPKGVIRRSNLALIATGFAFVFLALHRFDLSYLYSVMWALLSPRGMLSYLVLSLFFEPPFLAAYFLGYALVYWILVRTRREHWSFYILGAVAVIYLPLNLAEFVMFQDALLVINSFGISAVAAYFLARRPIHAAVLLFPVLMLAPGLAIFYAKVVAYGGSPYFVLLLSIALTLFAGIWLTTRHSPLEPIVRNVLLFWFVAFLLLTNRHYPFADNFDSLFVYSMALPHYLIGEVLSVAFMGILAYLLAQRWSRAARWIYYAGGALLVTLAFVDFEVSRALGTRLDWTVLTVSDDPLLAWRSIQPYFTSVAWIGALGLIAFFALCAITSGERTRGCLSRIHSGSAIYVSLATGLFCCIAPFAVHRDKMEGFAVGRLAATSPVAKVFDHTRLAQDQFFQIGDKLALLPASDHALPSPTSNKLNVVLIVMESSYNKYLSLFGAEHETQPLLKKYRDRMELFPNFYSVFPNSFHARFSVLSGLYPIKDYVSSVNPRIAAPSLLEILHDAGYLTDVFQSDPRQYVGFGDYIGHRHLDNWFDCSNMPGKEKSKAVSWGVVEKVTLEAMRQQIATHHRKQERFLLAYFPVAPHMPFDTPSKEFDKFPSGGETITQDYSGRYKNQLLYMDWIITTLIDTLAQEQLLEDTLVIITNDHGEMLGDQDERHRLGHGWALTPELCNTPLIILNPKAKGYRVNQTLGSQVDMLPTVADLLGLSLPAGELYQGQSLYSAKSDRTIYLNSAQHRAIVRGSKYILEERSSGTDEYPTHTFEISHQGTRTIFTPSDERADVRRELDSFERYQNALIAFYSDYRKAFAQLRRPSEPAVASRQ